MSDEIYYDGCKLLSMKDINGDIPEIFLATSNRSAGKTTYFNRLAVNRFLKKKSKFGILYRWKYELNDVADKFFKDIQPLFFPSYQLTTKSRSDGIYHELYLNNVPCGYALSINSAEQIKKLSHLFSDIELLIFDEFQSEVNKYCPDEVKKFQSIHTSIARGQGQQVRYVPVIMISNPVSIINPYYVDMSISARLQEETKFLRGPGYVLEQGFVDSAAAQQLESGFNKAFGDNKYLAYAAENVYLNDNKAFIGKPEGKGSYKMTLRYKGHEYAIRTYDTQGILYCDDHPDLTFPKKISVTTEDHNINWIMLHNNSFTLSVLRGFFEKGCCRFKDLRCKEAFMAAISYL